MSEPFIGQLSLVGFNFAPIGWFNAAGQLLPISQYTALFSLLGTYYGGDGRATFALPNMSNNVAIGMGQGPGLGQYFIGETGGTEYVTLLTSEVPPHTHTPKSAIGRVSITAPAGASFSDSEAGSVYSTTQPFTQMSPNIVPTYGGSQPHNNMMPFLGMYWIIAFQGVFPSRG